jgi:hypothetical protein
MFTDSLAAPIPTHTRRDVRLPAVPGKAVAVIGMRRSGKTTFLWQCLAERLATGTPREALLCLNFEDERLAGIQPTDLQWMVKVYYPLRPEFCDSRRVTFSSLAPRPACSASVTANGRNYLHGLWVAQEYGRLLGIKRVLPSAMPKEGCKSNC